MFHKTKSIQQVPPVGERFPFAIWLFCIRMHTEVLTNTMKYLLVVIRYRGILYTRTCAPISVLMSFLQIYPNRRIYELINPRQQPKEIVKKVSPYNTWQCQGQFGELETTTKVFTLYRHFFMKMVGLSQVLQCKVQLFSRFV